MDTVNTNLTRVRIKAYPRCQLLRLNQPFGMSGQIGMLLFGTVIAYASLVLTNDCNQTVAVLSMGLRSQCNLARAKLGCGYFPQPTSDRPLTHPKETTLSQRDYQKLHS